MTGQEALKIIDRLLEEHRRGTLKTIQAEIVSQVWKGDSYQTIGRELGYDPEYIKQVASQLWKLLSEVVGQKVSKSNLCAIVQRYQTSLTIANWGEAIDVAHFYGRVTELETLEQWILVSRCRLVGVFGWGGIGKTALSVKLAKQLESEFEYVVWRSLQHAPTLKDLLDEILPILMGSEVRESSLGLLMEQLRQHRCLLVLDNVESILQQGERCGYLGGYEAYGELFDRISDERHQSCILLTGREKPHGMTQREGVNLPVRSIQLTGLSIVAAHHILIEKGINSPLLDQKNLIDYVGGNPLALKLVATTVQNLFGGDIQGFLAQGTGVFSNLQDLLAEQFDRFSPLQQQVMYWLAINREGVTPARLQAEFLPTISLPTLLSALETLHDRSSIETTERGLTQQPVIMEYVTARFIQQIEREIVSGELDLFHTHALIEAQTPDYLRDAQIQLILQPLIDRLLTHFTATTQLERQLDRILSTLHQQPQEIPGYGAGNLLNLFCHLNTNLQGYDFSHLWIRQAYLLNATLHDVDFRGSHISQTVFAETFGGVVGIKFSPDGQYLASGSDDGTVKLWAVATGECLYTYKGHTFSVNTIELSNCGQILASSSQDGSIRLWRVFPGSSNPEIDTLTGHNGRVWSIAFSPDGTTLVSGGEDLTVRLWDVATGKCLAEWVAHTGWVRFVAFSPDGRSIATASYDRSIKIWDVAKIPDFSKKSGWDVNGSKIERTLREHTNRVWSVEFSPDGRLLASGSADYTIKIWDWKLDKCLQTLRGHKSWVWKVVFSPCGQILASSSYDQTVKIWDIQTGECLKTLLGHPSPAICTNFSPDGKLLASCDFSGNIKLWQLQSGECKLNLSKHTNSVWSVAFSADGQWLVSASYDETIELWSVATGKYLKTFTGHQGAVLAAKFCCEDRSIISVGVDRTVKIWDIETGECLETLTGHTGLIYTLDLGNIQFADMDSPRSLVQPLQRRIAFTGSLDETIKVWDLAAAKCLATWKSLRPYEGMQIDRIRGLTKAQQAGLYALGTVRN